MFEENDHLYPAKPELLEPEQGFKLRRLLISMVLFFGLFLLLAPNSYLLATEIMLILLIHEAGHLIAMKLYGYNGLNMYFIPLLGAMASGQKVRVSQREKVWISLMGPLPGILIGAVLFLTAAFGNQNILLIEAGLLFMILNVVNLIPLDPLDGGNIIEALFFPTKEQVKMYFTLISSLLIILIGVYLEFYPILIFGFLMAFKVRAYQRNRAVHDDLDEMEINYRKSYHELSDREYWTLRRVFLENNPKIKEIIPDDGTVWENEKLLVDQVNQLLCINVEKNLSVIQKTLMLALYLLVVALPFLLVLIFNEPLRLYLEHAGF